MTQLSNCCKAPEIAYIADKGAVSLVCIACNKRCDIEHTNCSCPSCVPNKMYQLPEDAELDLPDITGYVVMPPEELEELRRVKREYEGNKNIKLAQGDYAVRRYIDEHDRLKCLQLNLTNYVEGIKDIYEAYEEAAIPALRIIEELEELLK